MKYGISVSAPGKLFLSGEYAVLQGAPAVITSVCRRVVAIPTRDNILQSLLLREIKHAVAYFLFQRTQASAGQLPNIDIDSTGFSTASHKLGIGSSAAVAAAATGALFEWAGLPIDAHREEIFKVADEAHRSYQDGKGSGADVATSVFGGTIVFSSQKKVEPAAIGGVEKVFAWTGKPASTVSLVEKVRQLEQAQPQAYHGVMDPLTTLAFSLARAYQENDVDALMSLTHRYGLAMDALGKAAGVAIVTAKMKRIATLAHQCNGASKPSGAGGGDACVSLFRNPADARHFKEKLSLEKIEVLNLQTHDQGLRRDA